MGVKIDLAGMGVPRGMVGVGRGRLDSSPVTAPALPTAVSDTLAVSERGRAFSPL